MLEGVADGATDLVVGTHALVQEGVSFKDLSLAIVDEQHRFGVHQRMALKVKGVGVGVDPDVLIMTATPIPRTLALTYYGDLDVVVLDELPSGGGRSRRAWCAQPRPEGGLRARPPGGPGGPTGIRRVRRDRRGNRSQVKAAEQEANRSRGRCLPGPAGGCPPRPHATGRQGTDDGGVQLRRLRPADLDHGDRGRRRRSERDRDARRERGALRARAAPSASRPDRAGGACLVLLPRREPEENDEARARLEAMVRTTDGFELADEDLKLRGEGTLFDVRQSGMPDLRLARLAEDLDLVKRPGRAPSRSSRGIRDWTRIQRCCPSSGPDSSGRSSGCSTAESGRRCG